MIAAVSGSVFFAPGNVPFLVALGLVAAIGLLELVSTLLGAGLSGFVDGVMPDLHLDTELHPELSGTHGALEKALSWLYFGRVPAVILFIVLLTAFGLSGLSLQLLLHGLTGFMLPAPLAALPAFAAALPLTRFSATVLVRILPKDETDAVSRASFVGRIAVLGPATARSGMPAQAKLRDQHGQTHYVLVEPDVEGELLAPGSEVLLVRSASAVYYAIQNTSAALAHDLGD